MSAKKIKRMSRTIICPKCGNFARITGRFEDESSRFRYIVECERDGEFVMTAREERKTRLKYSKYFQKMM